MEAKNFSNEIKLVCKLHYIERVQNAMNFCLSFTKKQLDFLCF